VPFGLSSSMSVNDFYEDMYGQDFQKGLNTPFLHRVLNRFLDTRYEAAARLAPGGDAFLDIGCGDGELLFLLRDKYARLYGMDVVESRLERIRGRLGEARNIFLQAGDANDVLPYEDNYFDTVTALSMLEHVFDPYHFIKECHRILKPDGTLVVQVPNIAWLLQRIRLLLGILPVTSAESGWDGGHLHYFTRPALKRLFSEQGFRVLTVTNTGLFAGIRRVWGSLLGADIVIAGRKK
jgi:ubiquinone/menaquinone biosynthesis C-methylase UbiE